jgi:hypothetical protein
MIKILPEKYSGGLGNKMFIYGAAQILSKNHGLMVTPKLLEYPCNYNKNFNITKFESDIIVNNNNFLEITNLKKIKSNLLLDGYFQTAEIVYKYKNDFKALFEIDQEPIEGTIIHYRLGDLLSLYNGEAVTKLCYFEKCIQYINKKENIYITTDSPSHESINYLIKKYNIKLIDIKRSDTIKFASRFTNKILSMGTFSWWIGLLGIQKSNVYCPIPHEYIDWMGNIYVLNNWNYVSYK